MHIILREQLSLCNPNGAALDWLMQCTVLVRRVKSCEITCKKISCKQERRLQRMMQQWTEIVSRDGTHRHFLINFRVMAYSQVFRTTRIEFVIKTDDIATLESRYSNLSED